MKKLAAILALLLAAALLFAACGPKNQPANTDEDETSDVTTTSPDTTLEEPTSEDETTAEDESGATTDVTTTGVDASSTEAAPLVLPTGKAEILALYSEVVNNVAIRQPTYNSFDYQKISNEKDLNPGVVDMLNTYFYKGGDQSLVPALESILDTRQLEAQKNAHVDTRVKKTGDNGERLPGGKSNTRWFGVSMNDKVCLATPNDVKSATIKDLGDGRVQIDLVIVDVKNPAVIKEGAATAPNAMAAFMEVQDIGIVFGLVDNAVTRNIIKLAGVNLEPSSYMLFSGSTCKLIYNAKTMECESLYQVGKMNLFLDGSIKGVECKGVPVKVDCVYDYTKFLWDTAYPA